MSSSPQNPNTNEDPSRSPLDTHNERSAYNARLASPIPSMRNHSASTPSIISREHGASQGQAIYTPLAGLPQDPQPSGPGASAIASALTASVERDARASLIQQPLHQSEELASPDAVPHDRLAAHHYGSFEPSSINQARSPAQASPYEDFDIVRRHLAGPAAANTSVITEGEVNTVENNAISPTPEQLLARVDIDEDEFSSLRMQGGDITREIYRRTAAEENTTRAHRSKSFSALKPLPEDEEMDVETMRQPGGFRRNHLMRAATSPSQKPGYGNPTRPGLSQQPSFITRNFYEFLSLYGHFAGEPIDEGDESEETDAETPAEDGHAANGETRPLLGRRRTTYRKQQADAPKKGAAGTIFMLLKAFVGTGVLFLPRAFLNGGMLFSGFLLLLLAGLSYYCFVMLTTSRLKLKDSFAGMGEMTYGKSMRGMINLSLIVSQLGFCAAYIVFTSENLQAFVLAVSHCKTYIDIKLMILMQLIIFLPLSLYRNLNNIAFVVYIADIFIVLGLIYLYQFGIRQLIQQHGPADIELFNPYSWPLFIGTATFTFEGVGLLIPVQDGMKRPQAFPSVLGITFVIITIIFVSMGAIAYAAFGSKTETVVILNLPQDSKLVNGVQFIYSLAILLSTPMQMFPVITIMENGLFKRSGKHSKSVKWQKNIFRFGVVMLSAMIAWVGANDLDKFVALVGSFACIPLVYVYPPLIHYRGVADKRWQKVTDLLLVALGVILMVYTSALTIMQWVNNDEVKTPGYCDRLPGYAGH